MNTANQDSASPIIIQQCTVLGGDGYPIAAGELVDLVFRNESFVVRYGNVENIYTHYLEVQEISITGPGTITSGGGFVGGGFGVDGALQGMAIAMVLNRLTSKSKIHTFISITSHLGEIHLHYSGMEPSALRIALSRVFTTMRRLDPEWTRSRMNRIETHLHEKLFNEIDYDRYKNRLLTPLKQDPIPAQKPKSVLPEYGMCSYCKAQISSLSKSCPKCTAIFNTDSKWKILPI